jgi:hypothetical protein
MERMILFCFRFNNSLLYILNKQLYGNRVLLEKLIVANSSFIRNSRIFWNLFSQNSSPNPILRPMNQMYTSQSITLRYILMLLSCPLLGHACCLLPSSQLTDFLLMSYLLHVCCMSRLFHSHFLLTPIILAKSRVLFNEASSSSTVYVWH